MSVSFESPHYLVLLALADEPNHGLALQRKIVGDTAGIELARMTIYDALKALAKLGMVEAIPRGRSTVYEITDQGRYHLEIAAKDKRETSRLAQQRLGYR